MAGFFERRLGRVAAFGGVLLIFAVLAAPGHDVLWTYWVFGWAMALPLSIVLYTLADWGLSRLSLARNPVLLMIGAAAVAILAGPALAWAAMLSILGS